MSREEYPIMSYGQTGRYFERNLPVSDLSYDMDSVMGYASGISNSGEVVRDALINPNTDEIKRADLRLFLREVLTEREYFIVDQSYEHGATQSEIAEKLGVSRQRVGVIMTKAMEKLSDLSLHF